MFHTTLNLAKRWQAQLSAFVITYFVVAWTCLRFFTKPSTYDLTTQQVLAHSWLHGYSGHVVLGSTNYLLKILLLYMPMDLLNGLPKVKLLILTILVNLLTYLLIFVAIKRILEHFRIKSTTALYVAIIWLSMIAGSEFWIQYTNSRNLEVAGAMFVLLKALNFIKTQTTKNFLWLFGLGTLVFFADSLMFYMVAIPIIIYATTLAFAKAITWRIAFLNLSTLMGSLGLSVIINKIVYRALNISIDSTSGSNPVSNLTELVGASKAAVHATIRQLDGGPDAGRLFMLIGLLLFGIGLLLFVRDSFKNNIPRQFVFLVFCFIAINELIYILSGKAAQGDTSRYLVVVGPVIAMAFSAVIYKDIKKYIKLLVIAAIALNVFLIGKTTVPTWSAREVPDYHLLSVARFMNSHDYETAYSSMDTATPLAYYSLIHQGSIYPRACLGNKLTRAYAYRPEPKLASLKQSVLILDNDKISNTPNICDTGSIISQLGEPIGRDMIDDGSQVLIYPDNKLYGL